MKLKVGDQFALQEKGSLYLIEAIEEKVIRFTSLDGLINGKVDLRFFPVIWKNGKAYNSTTFKKIKGDE